MYLFNLLTLQNIFSTSLSRIFIYYEKFLFISILYPNYKKKTLVTHPEQKKTTTVLKLAEKISNTHINDNN